MISSPIAFDSLAYVKKLRAVGVPEKQAEVQAEAFYKIVEERLATKQDILALIRDMKELETSIKRDNKELEMRLTIRLGAMMTAGIIIVTTGCNPIITVKKNGDKFIIFMVIKASNSFVKIYDSVLLTC